MTQTNMRSYVVWDSPTRWFHWINFVCVVALAAVGTAILYDNELGVTDSGKLLLKTTHVWFGYVFAINLAWAHHLGLYWQPARKVVGYSPVPIWLRGGIEDVYT